MSKVESYRALRIRIEGGIAFATIDHPPINLLDWTLIVELDRFGCEVEADPDVRVVVIDSANPEFFIAHADVNLILRLPREPQHHRPSSPSSRQWRTDLERCRRQRSR